MIGGLSWNENGNPAYCCLIHRVTQPVEKYMEEMSHFELYDEYKDDSLMELLEQLPTDRISCIYAPKGKFYATYIQDFNKWRRSNGNILLRPSSVSSFEAGVLKIRDMLNNNELRIKEDSILMAQLKIFSKQSLKENDAFYAIKAMTYVINGYNRTTVNEEENVPRLCAWY